MSDRPAPKLTTRGIALTLSVYACAAWSSDPMPDIDSIDIFVDSSPVTTVADSPLHTSIAYQSGATIKRKPETASDRLDFQARYSQLLSHNILAQADGKLILRGPGDNARENSKQYEVQYRLRELFAQTGRERWSVKAGFQPVIWGELDAVSLLDVLTPRDFTEFAFTAPDEARISQAWFAFDFYTPGKFSLLWSPAPQTTHYPGGDVSNIIATVLGTHNFSLRTTNLTLLKDSEVAARWRTTVGGSDISLQYAYLYNDDPRFSFAGSNSQNQPQFDLDYPSYQLVGASANYAQGRFLWRAEAAYEFNKAAIGIEGKTDLAEFAAGLEFNANGAYTLQGEISHKTITSNTIRALGNYRQLSQAALRWSKSFLNDTASIVYYLSYQLQYHDTVHSAGLHYALTDRLSLDLNATIFVIHDENSPLRFANNWDQAVVKIAYAIN